jgi:RNA polymerase-binding transcription factor DksA
MSNLERNSNGLCDVRNALRRIDAPTSGVWVGYEEKINPKRLAVVPWASSCIVCQEAVEKMPRSEIDITLVMAA